MKVLRGKPVKSKPRKTGGEVKKRDTRKREGVKRERKKNFNNKHASLMLGDVNNKTRCMKRGARLIQCCKAKKKREN